MPRTKPPYPAEFRAEAVRLAKRGEQPMAQIARGLGVSTVSLRTWIRESEPGEDGRPTSRGMNAGERLELMQLRRRVKVLEEEQGILLKASAFFAREADSRPR
jgi:transposase